MFSPIPGSYHVQDAVQICVWLLFLGLAVAAHTAQSEEGKFATDQYSLSTKTINTDIRRQLPYRFDTNIALNRQNNVLPSATRFNSTPESSFLSEPKNEDGWSINIQKQAPTSSNCSPFSSLTCFDSNAARPDDAKPQQDSLWFVLRKAFHF